MATRYNKIYAGPVSEPTVQVQEAICDTAIKPGSILALAAGKFVLAPANATGTLFVAQGDYLAMKNAEKLTVAGDRIVGMEMLDEQFFNVLVATGSNLSKGDKLALGVGKLVVGAGRTVAFSEETYNNNTGEDQLVRVRVAKNAATA